MPFKTRKQRLEGRPETAQLKRKWEIYTTSVLYIYIPLKSFCIDLSTLICTIKPKWLIEAMFVDFLSWANLW